MTDTTAPSTGDEGAEVAPSHDGPTRREPPSAAHFPLAVALIALGDLALFDVTPGAMAGVFSAALVVATASLNPGLLTRRLGWLMLILLLVGCLAFVEEPSFPALGLGVLGLAAFVVSNQTRSGSDAISWLQRSGSFLLGGFVRLPLDLFAIPNSANQHHWYGTVRAAGWMWLLPFSMSLIFLALFSAANPVIANWLDLWRVLDELDISIPSAARVAFWVAIAFGIWAFLRGRPRDHGDGEPSSFRRDCEAAQSIATGIRASALSPAVVCRSLVLFNAVFALQNFVDARFLWAGEELPNGVTYADYAHAGTYPLAASALLAAVFVLLAFPSGPRANGYWKSSALMYLWMAQTVFMVASAMYRMGLYIDAYALTQMRIVGLVTMGLIAAGLVLITLRIALAKDNVWLINANAAVLAGTLYVACFVDTARIIADYNVANCREMGGNGVPLDVAYLNKLGTSAIPALERFETDPRTLGTPKAWFAMKSRTGLEAELLARQLDWRSWTYRGYKLANRSAAS